MYAHFRRYIAIPTVFLFLLGLIPLGALSGCRLKSCGGETTTTNPLAINCGLPGQPANIAVWFLFENPTVMQGLAQAFKATHPNAEVTTFGFDNQEEYLKQLGQVSGSPEAPDVYQIQNDWLPLFKGKLSPLPDIVMQRDPDAYDNLDDYLANFMPAVRADFLNYRVLTNQATGEQKVVPELYGLPWGAEGLALFVNTDHFKEYNNAFPADPLKVPASTEPMSWEEFSAASQKLIKLQSGWLNPSANPGRQTVIDPSQVVRYGSAIGYGEVGEESNVDFSNDILQGLWLQNDVEILSTTELKAAFNVGQYRQAASDQLRSYASYSSVWGRRSEGWPNSMQAFAEGRVSMAFGRSYQINGLPGTLKYSIVPFPQRSDNPSNWAIPAYYWGRVVNRNSPYLDCAWEFVKFVASHDQMATYNQSSRIPPARVDLTDIELDELRRMDVFSRQTPYYVSWYKGNWEEYEPIISKMINNVAINGVQAEQALDQAAADINRMLNEFN